MFMVYVLTMHQTVPGGDSGELIVAACTAGVPHPPGYSSPCLPRPPVARGGWAQRQCFLDGRLGNEARLLVCPQSHAFLRATAATALSEPSCMRAFGRQAWCTTWACAFVV